MYVCKMKNILIFWINNKAYYQTSKLYTPDSFKRTVYARILIGTSHSILVDEVNIPEKVQFLMRNNDTRMKVKFIAKKATKLATIANTSVNSIEINNAKYKNANFCLPPN